MRGIMVRWREVVDAKQKDTTRVEYVIPVEVDKDTGMVRCTVLGDGCEGHYVTRLALVDLEALPRVRLAGPESTR